MLTLAALAALVLLAVAALWIAARSDAARRLARDYLADLTGLPVSIDGLSIGFLPAPALELEGLAIAQPPGFGDDPLLDFGNARVSMTWRSLFGGDPAIRSIAVSDATVRPAFIADGSDNWSQLIERLSGLGGEGESRWSIERLDIENGALEFYDAASNLGLRLTAITVGAGPIKPAMDFPVDLQLAGVSGAHILHFAIKGSGFIDPDAGRYLARDLSLRGWLGGEPLPLAGIELEGGIGVASFDGKSGISVIKAGRMTFAGIRGGFELQSESGDRGTSMVFTLTTEPFSLRSAALAFGHPLPVTADPRAFQSVQVTARGHFDQDLLQLDPIEGRLDDTQWSGSILPQFRQVRIRADSIDLDRYLAPESKTRREKKATLEESIAELGKLDMDAEIRIAEARVAGAKLRNVVLKVERGGGTAP